MGQSLRHNYRTEVLTPKGKRYGRVREALFDPAKPVVVGYIVERPRIRLETPHRKLLGYVAYDRPERRELIVHEVNHSAELADGDMAEVPGGVLVLDAGYRRIAEVHRVFPGDAPAPLPFLEEGGTYRIILPPVAIHQVVRIRYDPSGAWAACDESTQRSQARSLQGTAATA